MDIYELHQAVIDGHKKALPAFIELKRHHDAMNLVLEALKELATEEFQNEYGGKEQMIAGATVSSHASGRYSYDHIPEWKQVANKKAIIEKTAQLAYKAGGPVVDEETGAIQDPAKYIPNKQTIAIKFPKG